MNVLFLSTNTERAAYVRFRALQYFPGLVSSGVLCSHRSLFDHRMDEIFYSHGRTMEKIGRLMRGTFHRAFDVAGVGRFDLVVVLREAHLVGPPISEHVIRRLGIPMILDMDDAIWQSYVSPTYGRMARTLKCVWKTDTVLGLAKAVTAGSQYVADYARQRNRDVTILPTVVDTEIYRPAERKDHGRVTLGWMGSHSSFQYVRLLFPVLNRLSREVPFNLRLVGSCAELSEQPFPVENVAWRPEREVADLQSFDVGLFPIVDDDWSRGKSGFKAVQYGAVGIPVVAARVTTNCDVVRDGVTGFLADSDDEWYERLRTLVLDASLRQRLGSAARQWIEEKYSLAVHGPRLLDVIRRVAAKA